jgi:biotin carboxylase
VPHVAFIESNTSGSGFRAVQTARRLGYTVTFVTRDPAYYRTPNQPLSHLLDGSDHVLTTETNDPAALTAALAGHRDRHGLDGITCSSEYYLHSAAVAARALGLPGPDPDAVARARNKAATRQALDGAGLPNPRYAVVDTALAALAAAADIGYPCVLKPVDRSSSTNVRLVDGPDALAEHYARMTRQERHSRGWALAREVLVEEYLHGPEFSVETAACRGEIRVLGTTSKGLAGGNAFAENEAIFPAPALLPWQRRYVQGAAVAALRALGLDHGVCHTEVKLTGRGPRIVEVNARVGGYPIPDLVRLATGFDLTAAAVQLAVGERPDFRTGALERAAGARFFGAPQAGTFAGVHGLEQVAAAADVVEVGRTAAAGQWVQPPQSNSDFVGHVLAVGARNWDVAARLDEIAAAVQVRVAAHAGPVAA